MNSHLGFLIGIKKLKFLENYFTVAFELSIISISILRMILDGWFVVSFICLSISFIFCKGATFLATLPPFPLSTSQRAMFLPAFRIFQRLHKRAQEQTLLTKAFLPHSRQSLATDSKSVPKSHCKTCALCCYLPNNRSHTTVKEQRIGIFLRRLGALMPLGSTFATWCGITYKLQHPYPNVHIVSRIMPSIFWLSYLYVPFIYTSLSRTKSVIFTFREIKHFNSGQIYIIKY